MQESGNLKDLGRQQEYSRSRLKECVWMPQHGLLQSSGADNLLQVCNRDESSYYGVYFPGSLLDVRAVHEP